MVASKRGRREIDGNLTREPSQGRSFVPQVIQYPIPANPVPAAAFDPNPIFQPPPAPTYSDFIPYGQLTAYDSYQWQLPQGKVAESGLNERELREEGLCEE